MAVGPAQVIWEWLTASGTGLYTLCGTRAWHAQAAENAAWVNTNAALIFTLFGDGGPFNGQYRGTGLSVRCYGGSGNSDDAEAVYEAVRARMVAAKKRTVASGTIERAEHVGDGVLLKDPDTEYWYMVARFDVDIVLA